MQTTDTTNEGVTAPGPVPSGALYSSRINPCDMIAGEPTETSHTTSVSTPVPDTCGLRRHTVKARKSKTARCRKTVTHTSRKTQKADGLHVPRSIWEAAKILRNEGYLVGKVIDTSGPVFDLIAFSGNGDIRVRVVRPKDPVTGARSVEEFYEHDIRIMQQYYTSPSDNLQFWIFSRFGGLLRYRIFDWGIGNVSTLEKIMKKTAPKMPETNNTAEKSVNPRARNVPCPK